MDFNDKDVSLSAESCFGPGICDARHIKDLDTLGMVAQDAGDQDRSA